MLASTWFQSTRGTSDSDHMLLMLPTALNQRGKSSTVT